MKPTTDLAVVAEARLKAANGELLARRLALKVKQGELAASLNKTPATISRWESGRRCPNAEDAVRWLRLLRRLEARATAQ